MKTQEKVITVLHMKKIYAVKKVNPGREESLF